MDAAYFVVCVLTIAFGNLLYTYMQQHPTQRIDMAVHIKHQQQLGCVLVKE